MGKLGELVDISGMSITYSEEWLTQIWKAAHQIELSNEDDFCFQMV